MENSPERLKELARQMVRDLERQAAEEPDGLLAAQIAMTRELEEKTHDCDENSLGEDD